jgi:hypothetical protein
MYPDNLSLFLSYANDIKRFLRHALQVCPTRRLHSKLFPLGTSCTSRFTYMNVHFNSTLCSCGFHTDAVPKYIISDSTSACHTRSLGNVCSPILLLLFFTARCFCCIVFRYPTPQLAHCLLLWDAGRIVPKDHGQLEADGLAPVCAAASFLFEGN